MTCELSRSFAKMDSRKKALLTGIIYFLLLFFGTFCFQKIEKQAAVERCDRFVLTSDDEKYKTFFLSAKEKAKKFKDDLVSKSFYRFDYHGKVCENLGLVFNNVSD